MSYTPVGRYIVWPLQALRETITVKEQGDRECIVEWEADTEHLTSSLVVETALGGFYAAGLQHLETILIKVHKTQIITLS